MKKGRKTTSFISDYFAMCLFCCKLHRKYRKCTIPDLAERVDSLRFADNH
jgi:hypothetical protein